MEFCQLKVNISVLTGYTLFLHLYMFHITYTRALGNVC